MVAHPLFRVLVVLTLSSAAGRKKLNGIHRFLNEGGDWNIELVRSESDLERQWPVLRKTAFDGLVVSSPDTDVIAKAAQAFRIPSVFIAYPQENILQNDPYCVFIVDSEKAIAREAAGHFTVQCHPQTIAYVPTREPTRWSDLRRQAFADELAARGRKLAVYGGAGASRDDLNAWIRELPKPAGILAAYDDRAYDVLETCRNAGVRVPQEVSVLGIGNDEQTCEMSVPPLTSLAVDFEMQGYRAARELQAMMLRRRKPLQRQILCGVREMVIRNSTLVVKSDSLADRARAYIDRHALEGISPDDVVRHLNASRSLVYLRFRQAFGESPLDAILAKRLGEVKRLLETTALSMSEVAVRCGYRDANYLKNLFKKRFGCTMLAWRKERRRQS